MLRKLNFTERARIPRDAVRITLRRDSDGVLVFDAGLNLDGLSLPGEAHVFLEAVYRNSYMRFDCGRAGDVAVPADRRLTGIDGDSVVRFRVKVVDRSAGGHRILASSDDLTVSAGDRARSERQSILPVNFRDLGDVPWRVEVDSGGPVLELNNRIDGIETLAISDPTFFALVYPAAVREIFTHLLVIEAFEPDDDDSDEWPSLWMRWARELSEAPPPDDPDERRAWIDDVTAAFCARHAAVEHLRRRETEATS